MGAYLTGRAFLQRVRRPRLSAGVSAQRRRLRRMLWAVSAHKYLTERAERVERQLAARRRASLAALAASRGARARARGLWRFASIVVMRTLCWSGPRRDTRGVPQGDLLDPKADVVGVRARGRWALLREDVMRARPRPGGGDLGGAGVRSAPGSRLPVDVVSSFRVFVSSWRVGRPRRASPLRTWANGPPG